MIHTGQNKNYSVLLSEGHGKVLNCDTWEHRETVAQGSHHDRYTTHVDAHLSAVRRVGQG